MRVANIVLATVVLMGVSPGSLFASELVHTTATLSEGRYWLSATTVGNKALFAGGMTTNVDEEVTSVVDIYDANVDMWSTAMLSEARAQLAATTVGTKAMFAGGFGSGDFPEDLSDVVDIYDADTALWTTATLSGGRDGLAAGTVGNKALFAGGVLGAATRML